MKSIAGVSRPQVSGDGVGLVSNAGVDLLYRTAAVTGLDERLREAFAPWLKQAAVHHPGKIILDLVVMLAAGGDCPADVGMLRNHPDVFGLVGSDSTVSRLVNELAGTGDDDAGTGESGRDDVAELAYAAIRSARAASRALANTLTGDREDGEQPEVVVDVDATLITAHSEKVDAAPTYKRGYGHHPLMAYLDHGPTGTGEGLAGLLRPGNANAGKASDHLTVLDQIEEQLSDDEWDRLVIRTDTAAANHEFLQALHDRGLDYSVGFYARSAIADAIDQLPSSAWIPAIDADGKLREGAWVAELSTHLDLSTWPPGIRIIARKERPHPGAQLRLTDHDGHRITCIATNHTSTDLAWLEARHRSRARCEDRIRAAKDTGLHNLPYHHTAANQLWIELVLTAQTLTAHLQQLALQGEYARYEPKRLRLHLFSVAARYVTTGRQQILRLDRTWPWTRIILAAVTRLNALPAPG